MPAPDPCGERLVQRRGEVAGKRAVERPAVDLGHEPAERVDDRVGALLAHALGRCLEERLECRAPFQSCAELLAILVGHAVQPVETGRAPGGDPGDRRSRSDEPGKQGRAGERMRAATRPTDDLQALQTERPGDGVDVRGAIGDRSSRAAGRPGVPGS